MIAKAVAVTDEVVAERRRQIEDDGWTPDHDDEHTSGELALAAVCLASPELLYRREDRANGTFFSDPWPWGVATSRGSLAPGDKRPHDGNSILPNKKAPVPMRRRQLVKAAALLVAEIERIDRAQLAAKAGPGRNAGEDNAVE